MIQRLPVVAFALTLLGTPAAALEARLPLERQLARAPDERVSGFESASTVEIAYYNTCTGWIWVWSGVPPGATYGVFYDDPSTGEDRLLRTHMYFRTGAPSGYGFTCLARAMSHFEPGCPGGMLEYQFFLPQAGWNTIEWNGDDGIEVEDCWVIVDHSKTPGDPTEITTEKGERGGPRPGGCTVCFSPARPRHSFQLGMKPEIVCPGIPWVDQSLCDLELLWKSDFRLNTIAVEGTSWGRLKGLYR